MPMHRQYNTQFTVPSLDASLGFIFRMNRLWSDIDLAGKKGDYDMWESLLDRVWVNLIYRNPMEEVYDANENLIDVNLSENDTKARNIMKKKVAMAKLHQVQALRKGSGRDLKKAQKEQYEALLMFDASLRKLMQSLGGIYLKETQRNPATAMFGGG